MEAKHKDFSEMSVAELKEYLKNAKAEIKKIKAETAEFNRQALEHRNATHYINGQLDILRKENEFHIKRLGWEELTEEEVNWCMTNYFTEWKIFKPTVFQIKTRFAEISGKGDQEFLHRFDNNPEMKNPSGWLNRLGQYHGVGFGEHNSWARTLLEEKYGEKAEEKKGNRTWYETLEAFGWVRIMKWGALPVRFLMSEELPNERQEKKLTHAQKRAIYTYCQLYKVALPFNDPLFNN
jgi:hypothetical protein